MTSLAVRDVALLGWTWMVDHAGLEGAENSNTELDPPRDSFAHAR